MYKINVYKLKLVRSSSKAVKVEVIKNPEAAAQVLTTFLKDEDREHFVVVMLDIKNRVIGINTVSIGTINETLVHPREVFKAAILANAHAIILGHNHPTGDVTPSVDDLDVTRELVKAGEYLKIQVLDHIIIGENGKYASLLEMGLIEPSDKNKSKPYRINKQRDGK